MSRRSMFEVVRDEPGKALVIKDVGFHEPCLSVTNDAERVVAFLAATGKLPAGRRLFYFDSEGQLDELRIAGGKFAGFAPGPKSQRLRDVP